MRWQYVRVPLHTYDQAKSQPSLVVLSRKSATPVFNYSTSGSMLAAAIVEDHIQHSALVAIAGCTTHATCTGPGAQAFVFAVRSTSSYEVSTTLS